MTRSETMMTTKLFAVLVMCASWGHAAAQLCADGVSRTTPTHRYQLGADATVVDVYTGLTWFRCPVGFRFEDGGTSDVLIDDQCVAESTTSLTWQESLQAAADLNAAGGYAGHADWRVPNAKELLSIVEFACLSPSSNTEVFPRFGAEQTFWSSTTSVTSRYTLDFSDGQVSKFFGDILTKGHAVRLVR